MTTKREEALATASIKFGQMLLRSPAWGQLLHSTPDGRRFVAALTPYINQDHASDMPAPPTNAEIDAYFNERWAHFNAGAEAKRKQLDEREARINKWQAQMQKRCSTLAKEIEALPRMRLTED